MRRANRFNEGKAPTRLIYVLLLLLLLVYISVNIQLACVNPFEGYHSQLLGLEQSFAEPTRKPRLGDGCYHVFLDVGANVGVHGRFLLEPQKYPETTSSGDLFRREYGLLDNRNVCVFEFEANPRQWPRLEEISKAYAKMGWRYHVIQAAVSDEDGSATFYHQGKRDEKNNEWGFSGAWSHGFPDATTVEVPTVRLSKWIQTHIHERIVPKMPSDYQGKKNPVLGMKIDIEGFEYIVLPDLINSGAVCNFNFIFGEFHAKLTPIPQIRSSTSQIDANDHGIVLANKQEYIEYAKALVQVMQASKNCQVRWLELDEESYLHDGQPLPDAATSSS